MRNEGGGFAEILRLRSQLFWHSLSHIRRFSPLRMTKRGDARRLYELMRSSYRKPSPRGEGAPKGRIGHWRYEREWGNAFQSGDLRQQASADFCKRRCAKVAHRHWQGNDTLVLRISAFTHLSFIGLQGRFLASLEMTIRESDISSPFSWNPEPDDRNHHYSPFCSMPLTR